jgi:hypothetical protein
MAKPAPVAPGKVILFEMSLMQADVGRHKRSVAGNKMPATAFGFMPAYV